MSNTRRGALMGLAAFAGMGGVARAAETKGVEASKLFPYYDLYLGIPAGERSKFVLAYFLTINGKPPSTSPIVLVGAGGARTVLTVGPDGRVTKLPTLADFKAKAKVELTGEKGMKFSLNMEMLALVRGAPRIEAAELSAAIAQCDGTIKKRAGLLGFAAPKIRRVVFKNAAGGQAVSAAGTKPLPLHKGLAYYDPEQMPGVTAVTFTKPPSAIMLAGRPKT